MITIFQAKEKRLKNICKQKKIFDITNNKIEKFSMTLC